jgi:hypothetical protein
MINLIPKEEKKRMKADFMARVATVSFVLLSSVVLIASAALVPAYLEVSVDHTVARKELDIQKNTPLKAEELEITTQADNLNRKIQQVDSLRQNKFLVTERAINNVVLNKLPDIKITNILYEAKTSTEKEIKVTGSAPSREKLLLFKLALENDPAFKKVDLPVSNFVKGSDIKFFVILIPA